MTITMTMTVEMKKISFDVTFLELVSSLGAEKQKIDN